jgi:hypothetical protein
MRLYRHIRGRQHWRIGPRSEYAGQYASPNFPLVLLANVPWLVFPLIIIGRMWRSERPFTQPLPLPETGTVSQIPSAAKPEGLETSEAAQ